MEDADEYTYDGTRYELLRAQAGFASGIALPAKVRWCSYILFADALALPLVLLLPARVQSAYVGPDPASASLALAGVGLSGGVVVFAAGVGLALLTVRRANLGELSDDQATWLVGVESMASALGFVTGGAAVVIAVVGLAVGFGGTGTVELLLEHGADPYRAAPVVPPLTTVAAADLGLGAVLAVVGHLVRDATR